MGLLQVVLSMCKGVGGGPQCTSCKWCWAYAPAKEWGVSHNVLPASGVDSYYYIGSAQPNIITSDVIAIMTHTAVHSAMTMSQHHTAPWNVLVHSTSTIAMYTAPWLCTQHHDNADSIMTTYTAPWHHHVNVWAHSTITTQHQYTTP